MTKIFFAQLQQLFEFNCGSGLPPVDFPPHHFGMIKSRSEPYQLMRNIFHQPVISGLGVSTSWVGKEKGLRKSMSGGKENFQLSPFSRNFPRYFLRSFFFGIIWLANLMFFFIILCFSKTMENVKVYFTRSSIACQTLFSRPSDAPPKLWLFDKKIYCNKWNSTRKTIWHRT